MASTLNTLTPAQLSVIEHLLEGENAFLTGGGGVGKSFLISLIYNEFPNLKRQLNSIRRPGTNPKLSRVQLCAMTGCAALLLGNKAKTLHSWGGIGLGKGTVSELYIKIRRNKKSMRNWLCTDLLIIDEVSMMTAELLDKLNELAKKIRSNKLPFGGIQLLLVGDFYQLPPVNRSDEITRFAFDATCWKELITTSIELTEIQRQKDEVFQKILGEARIGELSKESCEILRGLEGRNWRKNKIRPTLIFPKRAEVEMINDANLRALEGRRYTYKARLVYDGKMPDRFSEDDEDFVRALKKFDTDASYLTELELAIGAQVMLIANIDPDCGLVNGSRGVVVEFSQSTESPVVEFINGIRRPIGTHTWPIEDYEFVSRSQVPLRLAYANTTHKLQGSTLDSALIDIGSGNFEFGQAYVALSRVKDLSALYVYDFDPLAFKANPRVKEFYKHLEVKPVSPVELSILRQVEQTEETRSVELSITEVPLNTCINVIKESDESEDPVNTLEEHNWLYHSIPNEWKTVLEPCKNKLLELSTTLDKKEYLPSKENIWRALELTPLDNIKVVILGQDPYPTPGNAMGLAFSVSADVRPLPASLKNIYKEMGTDVGVSAPLHGNLEQWARQGILLLNTVLTVLPGEPQSHSKIGWEDVTDQIIRTIAEKCAGVVFVLWGRSAQEKKKILRNYVDKNGHKIFESAHPSPLSASRGFFGSKPFSTINGWLKDMGKAEIKWEI